MLAVNRARRSFVSVALALAFGACRPWQATPEAEPASADVAPQSPDVQRVLAVVGKERQRRGLAPVLVIDDLRALESAVAGILRGGSPEDAIRTAMERIAEYESGEVYGWIVQTEQLDDVQLPSAFVEREEPSVAVIVVRREGTASVPAHYLVCFLLVEDGTGPGIQSY